jgi:hypothetical protein
MKCALLAIALTLAPTAAEAACQAANLAGTWDAYVFGSEPEGTYILRCILRPNASGRLRSGSSCDGGSTLAGQFTINRNCRFTAAITQHFEPGQVIRCSFRGTLAKSKDDFAAIGQCTGIVLVNAIKR